MYLTCMEEVIKKRNIAWKKGGGVFLIIFGRSGRKYNKSLSWKANKKKYIRK